MIRLSNATPIQDLRLALKLSQAELARRLGVDQSNISAMERRMPTLRSLARVLAKLGLEPVLMAGPVTPATVQALADEVQALEAREAELQGRLAELRAGQ